MLKHLISLVFLFFSLSYLPALSDNNLKLLPKSKPTISAVKNEKKISVILPKKKPNIKLIRGGLRTILNNIEKNMNKSRKLKNE